jgi:hypothetical protein
VRWLDRRLTMPLMVFTDVPIRCDARLQYARLIRSIAKTPVAEL